MKQSSPIRPAASHPPRTARRGSVMIMVVALLVLLAIMGTAYLATSRADRATAFQSVANQQVEHNVNSVINVLQSILADDVQGKVISPPPRADQAPRYFPADMPPIDERVELRGAGPFNFDNINHTGFENFDTPARMTVPEFDAAGKLIGVEEVDPDPWLADRLPEFRAGFRLTTPNEDVVEPSFNRYVWRWISAPISGTRGTDNYWEFDDPYGSAFYAPRMNLFPVIAPDGGPGMTWEANPGSNMLLVNPPYTAADTDGDGIGDAFLSKLQGATTNGLTTYVAVRVVDNAAAVNAAIALEHWEPKSGRNTDLATNLFPVNIGISNAIAPNDHTNPADPKSSIVGRAGGNNSEWGLLQRYRTGSNASPNSNGDYVELNEPVSDRGIGRDDFEFRNEYDAMWHQLGRRPEFPGFNFRGTPYQRISTADTLALAHGFVVGTRGLSMNSTLETLLYQSLEPISWDRYLPDQVQKWGDYNFADQLTGSPAFGPQSDSFSRRPLIVTSNPVSQAAPVHLSRRWVDQWDFEHYVPFHPLWRSGGVAAAEMPDMLDYDLAARYKGEWAPDRYFPGDIVRAPNGSRTYICVRDTSVGNKESVNPTDVHVTTGNAANIASDYWEYQPYTPVPMKASLNTATFRELYRAFWSVMCDESDPDRHPLSSPPFYDKIANFNGAAGMNWKGGSQANLSLDGDKSWNNYELDHAGQMFRSSIRDHKSGAADIRLNGKNQALLRAALAAVNTIDLRDSDQNITSRTITLEAELKASGTLIPVKVNVYGYEKQPFITRVYLNTFTTTYTAGYGVIELFNPHDTEIDISNWRIITFERKLNGRNASHSFTRKKMLEIPEGTIVPAGGHTYLTNGDGDNHTQDILIHPLIQQAKQAGRKVFVRINNLDPKTDLFESEFVIVRPRIYAPGTPEPILTPPSTKYYDQHNESNSNDWIPVDQHDASGIGDEPPSTDVNAPDGEVVYAYERDHNGSGRRWKCVYPGRYNGNSASERYDDSSDINYAAKDTEPLLPNGKKITLGDDVSSSDNPYAPIQLGNEDFAGPKKTTTEVDNMFPFGGFARAGDVFQVPFIGAYKITALTGSDDEIIELNSISMDSALVADRDSNNNAREHLGRFCPPQRPYTASPGTNDTEWTYYDWAKDILDHFTVFAPYDDYFPNVVGGPPVRGKDANYPGFKTNERTPEHVATKFLPSTIAHDQPRETAVEGLININTAPWRVLATIPWTSGSDNRAHNYNIARSIVRHRQQTANYVDPLQPGLSKKGPFRTLMDLQTMRLSTAPGGPSMAGGSVIPFWQFPLASGTEPNDANGDISPEGSTTDLTRNDFEEQFLMLTRVSNLITTRSDSFTAYICLQQWENAGTPDARMVSQRRYAVLLDRSGIVKDKKDVKVSYVPID